MASRAVAFDRIPGIAVGHAETPERTSGVTVIRFDAPLPTVVDVRGGASATYDTASLSLDATFGRRWAIFFAGGSLYGLDAARGIRTRIAETGGGHRTFRNPNVIVPISGAALFDLPLAEGPIPDYLPLGYEATRRAETGSVADRTGGAGAGATVGKYLGRRRAMRGGLGSAATRGGQLGAVGVLVVVNSVGAIRDPATGHWIAGARGRRGRVVPPDPDRLSRDRTGATTLGLVVTEAALGRPALQRIAAMVHSGLARAIVPFHSTSDGDVIFVVSTERVRPRSREHRPGEWADQVGMRAAHLAVEAVLRAVGPAPSRGRANGVRP